MKGCQFDDGKLRLTKDCFVNPQSRSTRLVAASNVKFDDLFFFAFFIYIFSDKLKFCSRQNRFNK